MRISTEYGDPGFREDALLLDIEVRLDGRKVANAVMADSDRGVVKTRGEPISDLPGVYYQGIVVTSFGKVEIVELSIGRRF